MCCIQIGGKKHTKYGRTSIYDVRYNTLLTAILVHLITAERHYSKITHAEFHPNRSRTMERRVGIHLRPEANKTITEPIFTKLKPAQ